MARPAADPGWRVTSIVTHLMQQAGVAVLIVDDDSPAGTVAVTLAAAVLALWIPGAPRSTDPLLDALRCE